MLKFIEFFKVREINFFSFQKLYYANHKKKIIAFLNLCSLFYSLNKRYQTFINAAS